MSQVTAAQGPLPTEVPSLTGFLTRMETDDVEVKRQLDSEGGLIRVMTVHGAKGLEAEIVILPDTCDRSPQDRDQLYRLPDGPPICTALNCRPSGTPPPMSSTICRTVTPMGTSMSPPRTTLPARAKTLAPLLVAVPMEANASGP